MMTDVDLDTLYKAGPTPEGTAAARALLDLANRTEGREKSRDEERLSKRYLAQLDSANADAVARYESKQAAQRLDALAADGLLPPKTEE